MTAHESRKSNTQTDAGDNLESSDLEQIVRLSVQSGLHSQPRLPGKPTPHKVVWYEGRPYKVRGYASGDAARQKLELLRAARNFFVRCYGRADRYLVLEYIADAGPDSSPQGLTKLGELLAELERAQTSGRPQTDFDSLCNDVETAGVFLPRTVGLIRRYQRRAESPSFSWGLEHQDAVPKNFVLTREGRLLSTDEKHLRAGPRGVSLINAMLELPEGDFMKIRDAYLAKADPVPFQDPQYREFLLFYHLMYFLAFQAVNKPREANMRWVRWFWFHRYRQAVLQIVGAPLTVRLQEEAPWRVQYPLHRSRKFVQRSWDSLARRLTDTT